MHAVDRSNRCKQQVQVVGQSGEMELGMQSIISESPGRGGAGERAPRPESSSRFVHVTELLLDPLAKIRAVVAAPCCSARPCGEEELVLFLFVLGRSMPPFGIQPPVSPRASQPSGNWDAQIAATRPAAAAFGAGCRSSGFEPKSGGGSRKENCSCPWSPSGRPTSQRP